MNKRKKPYGLWEHVEDLPEPFSLLSLHASYSHYVPSLFPHVINLKIFQYFKHRSFKGRLRLCLVLNPVFRIDIFTIYVSVFVYIYVYVNTHL